MRQDHFLTSAVNGPAPFQSLYHDAPPFLRRRNKEMELSPTLRSSIRSHSSYDGIVGESIKTRHSEPITSSPSTACRIRNALAAGQACG